MSLEMGLAVVVKPVNVSRDEVTFSESMIVV